MDYYYWISPDKIALFRFIPDFISVLCDNKIDKKNEVDVTINFHSSSEMPHRITLDKWSLKKQKAGNYELISSFKILDSNQKINEIMFTKISDKKIEITVPFKDMTFLGNDLSFFLLMYDGSLTLRCSSFLMDSKLYLFLGRSGSGKSTVLKESIKHFIDRALPISDDHITIKIENKSIKAITPIWDEINIVDCGKNVKAKEIVFYIFDDSIINIIPITDNFLKTALLIKHCILFSYSAIVTKKIIGIINKIAGNYKIFICPIKNYNEIIRHIEPSV